MAVVRVRNKMEELEETIKRILDINYSLPRSKMIREAAEALRRNIPQEMEKEGGGSSWWYVCPECHGAIDRHDMFCRHCGQALK